MRRSWLRRCRAAWWIRRNGTRCCTDARFRAPRRLKADSRGRPSEATRSGGGRLMTRLAVVTMGTFDGVHRGHQAVLAEVTRRARAAKLTSVLVTFDPHPLAVVNPAAA